MWQWLRHLWSILVDAVLRTSAHAAESVEQHLDVYSRLETDTLNLMNAVRDLKHFEFNPKWKTRVILVPQAIQGIQEVFDIVVHGLRDKFAQLYQAIQTLKAALHAPPPSPDPQGNLARIVNVIGQIDVALQSFEAAYRQVTELAQMIDDVKHRIETLDDLFLQQGNTRKWVTEKLRQRVRR
jgi:hypothetical protein